MLRAAVSVCDDPDRLAARFLQREKKGSHDAFNPLLLYMSTQKPRTSKGLGWLAAQAKLTDDAAVLHYMVHYHQLPNNRTGP